MNRIPAEIWNCIFTKLHLLQKIECMLVCRNWYELITTQCLLETVVLNSERNATEQLKFLLQQIKDGRMNGHCTRHLSLENHCNDQLDMDELAMAFPNLRRLYKWKAEFKTPSPNSFTEEGVTTPPELSSKAHWLGKLEKVYDYGPGISIINLLKNGYQFSSLVSLTLFSGATIPFGDLCAHLTNTPLLTILELQNFEFSLDQFETLHQNLPLLNKLVLTNADVKPSTELTATESVTNDSIIPNTTVKTLEITENGEVFSAQADLARYIGKKYANLVHLTFQLQNASERLLAIRETDEYHIILRSLIEALGPQTKSFCVNFDISLKNVLELLAKKGNNQLSEIKFVYSTIHLLDEFDYNHPNSLRTLQLCNVDPFAFQMNSNKSALSNLKTLILSFRKVYDYWNDEWFLETIELNKLLNQCPEQLEHLVIEYAGVTADENHNKCFKQLKSLKLVNCDVHREMPKFLSTNCPNLQRLSFISSCFFFKRIDLPMHNIELLEIDSDVREYCFIITQQIVDDGKNGGSDNSKTRIYANDLPFPLPKEPLDDYNLYSGILPIPFDEVKNRSPFYFTCRSLQTFLVRDRIGWLN